MIVQYHCRGCCKKDEWRDVLVPERIGDTDLGAWMEVIQHCIICQQQACDLKIPLPKDIETNPKARVGHNVEREN